MSLAGWRSGYAAGPARSDCCDSILSRLFAARQKKRIPACQRIFDFDRLWIRFALLFCRWSVQGCKAAPL
jgi:hypothetical protein